MDDNKTVPMPRPVRPPQVEPQPGAEPPVSQPWDRDLNYRTLFEQMEDCVLIVSFDLRYVAVNPQTVRLLGYSEQELAGKPVNEIMYQDASNADENPLANTFGLFERLMRCKDGAIIPVEIRASMIYDQHGAPAYVQMIARDITERKNAEDALKYHNRVLGVINDAAARLLRSANVQYEIPEILQLLGRVTDLATCAIIESGDREIEARFTWQNPSASPIDLGKIMNYLLADPWANMRELFINANVFRNNPAGFAPVSIAFVPVLREDSTWGFLGLMTPDTRPEWDEAQREVIRTAANIIGAALQRQLIEARIRAGEEHSRTILAALPDLIIRLDASGNILDYSARRDHPLYMPRETVNGKKLSEIWSEGVAQQVAGGPGDKLMLQTELRREFKLPDSNNTYEARLDPIGLDETLIVIRDISDQARLDQMKSDFINRASHELRTPLTTAILMSDLLQNSTDEKEKAEYWQILNNELNRQKSLIDRLLTAGRLESGRLTLEPEALDLIAILDESAMAVKSIAKKKNIEINISAPPAPLMVWGDKSGLQQVFVNLINNATKFSPEGSTIKVEVSEVANRVQVAISDQGLGIPPEDLPNLFEQFFRARNVTLAEIPGSGVGLYIVKSIITELKGEIKVQSELNKGTTFVITLNKPG